MEPSVDINIAVYNHAHFLRQTLDSVLEQKTNFPFRILIADDCSTDGSVDILKEYESAFPDRVSVIYQNKNIGLASPERNGILLLRKSTAKYIAFLDGDDAWVDEHKLQKQVDFLEKNPDFILCFTRGYVENIFIGSKTLSASFEKDVEVTFSELINENNQLTASAVFVNKSFPEWYPYNGFADWLMYLWLMHSFNKKAVCLADITATYRIHGGGSHSIAHRNEAQLIKGYMLHLSFYDFVNKNILKGEYKSLLNDSIRKKITTLTKLHIINKSYVDAIKLNIRFLKRNLGLRHFYFHMKLIYDSVTTR